MFVGHFALGFAAKRATPRISLALLFLAAQFADLLWPLLVAAGIEQVAIEPGITKVTPLNFISYPYSHSLLMLLIWGVALGFAVQRSTKQKHAFGVIAALVVSHWLLDWITHRPDMPLYPDGPKVGLGLWNSVPGTLVVELSMYAVGVWVYLRATRARDAVGKWAFIGLAVFLLIAYLSNLAGAPPSVAAIYIIGLAGGILLLVWSWWADRHRDNTSGSFSALDVNK
jgi:hypothetical protein